MTDLLKPVRDCVERHKAKAVPRTKLCYRCGRRFQINVQGDGFVQHEEACLQRAVESDARNRPAIIYADGTVPCLECGGTGIYPTSGESCYACTNGVVEVLETIDAEDVR